MAASCPNSLHRCASALLAAVCCQIAPAAADEFFISRDPSAPIIINAESSEFDYAANRLVFHGLRLYQGEFGNRTLLGGFDVIHDCVGSARTTQDCLRACRAGGALVMVGLSLSRMKLDLTPVWHQEVDLIGSLIHGTETWEGERLSTYDLAGRWLAEGRLSTDGLITHRFPRARWREGVKKALAKREGVIKVVLE